MQPPALIEKRCGLSFDQVSRETVCFALNSLRGVLNDDSPDPRALTQSFVTPNVFPNYRSNSMKNVREGQMFEYDIFSAGLMLPFGITTIPELEELDISTASDNGNSIRVEQYTEHRYAGKLIAGAPGYAAVTTVVAKRDGTVLAVFGQQFYVARAEQGEIADGELPVREITQARAAAVSNTETHTESEAAPQTNSPDAATNELDEKSESTATI